jgi:hypothetical protein
VVKENDPKKIDYSKIKPLMGYTVNSAIATPIHEETITLTRDDPYLTI